MAFKMKGSPMQRNFGIKPNNSPVNMGKDPMKMAKNSALDMAKDPMKMVNKSPLDRALVGDQKNLPDHLKEKIEAAPPTKMVDKDPMKMAEKDPMKMVDPSPMKVAPLVGMAIGTAARYALPRIAKFGAKKLMQAASKKAGKKAAAGIVKKGLKYSTVPGKTITTTAAKGVKKVSNFLSNPVKALGSKSKVANFLGSAGSYMAAGEIGKKILSKKSTKPKTGKVETTKPKVTLDTKVKGGSKTWRQGMKSSGGNLNDLAKKRDTLKKGSDEYNAVQNKINVHLGSKKRHGVTSSTGTKGRKTTATKKVPGVSSSTSVTKKRNIGGTKTVVNKSNLMNNTSSKTKTKNNKRKVTTYNEDGTISKTKVNTRTGRVKTKTRKKGGTGLFNRKDKSQF